MSYDSLGARRRAPAGYTYGCPACQDPEALRPKDDVCRDCRTLLADAATARAARAALTDVVAVRFSDVWHWNPYLAIPDREAVATALTQLVWTVGTPVETGVPTEALPGIEWEERVYYGETPRRVPVIPDLIPVTRNVGYHSTGGYKTVLLPRAFVDHFRALWAGIEAAAATAKAEGFERGRNLLERLASGDMTVAEYNKLTIGE